MENKVNVIFILFIIVTLAFGYFWYTRLRTVSPDALLVAADSEREIGREFVSSVNRMRALVINTDFFINPVFESLKDMTPTIELPLNFGRDNPFWWGDSEREDTGGVEPEEGA